VQDVPAGVLERLLDGPTMVRRTCPRTHPRL